MGPRSVDHGKPRWNLNRSSSNNGFNGAAISRSRKGLDFELLDLLGVLLQWGRDQSITER